MSPELRARALLSLGAIDPYNEVHVALMHSVDTPTAGTAGPLVKRLWNEIWYTEEYIVHQESHFFDVASYAPDDPDPFSTDHTDAEIEHLAKTLLKGGRWRRSEQSVYVYLASCFGRGANSHHLRALALIDGIIVQKRIEGAYQQ